MTGATPLVKDGVVASDSESSDPETVVPFVNHPCRCVSCVMCIMFGLVVLGVATVALLLGTANTGEITYASNDVLEMRKAKWWYNQVVVKSASDATFFAVNTHQYGYSGIQMVSRSPFKGQVIFSLWKPNGTYTALNELPSGELAAGEGVMCGSFDHEGEGTKCIWEWNGWQLGRTYGFMTLFTPVGDRVQVSQYFHADELGGSGWKMLATIEVPAYADVHVGWNKETPLLRSFLEQWDNSSMCDDREALFGPTFISSSPLAEQFTQLRNGVFVTFNVPWPLLNALGAQLLFPKAADEKARIASRETTRNIKHFTGDIQDGRFRLASSMRFFATDGRLATVLKSFLNAFNRVPAASPPDSLVTFQRMARTGSLPPAQVWAPGRAPVGSVAEAANVKDEAIHAAKVVVDNIKHVPANAAPAVQAAKDAANNAVTDASALIGNGK